MGFFFYLPIFPFGILICFIVFIFAFFLEKYNFIKKYKKPIILNSRIYEVYSNFFVINLFAVSLGNYLFLKDALNSNFWLMVHIILLGILVIFPYNNLLSIDLIRINEGDIKAGEKYEDYFYNFFNDYERNNPITKKLGIKHFLDKLLEKVLITKNDYDTILENYEHMNLLEIYYKSKLHFGYNLLKRAFFHTNFKKRIKNIKFIKNMLRPKNIDVKNDKNKDSEYAKEEPIKINNLYKNYSKVSSSKHELVINLSGNQKITLMKKKKIKKG